MRDDDPMTLLEARVFNHFPRHALTLTNELGTFTIGYVFVFGRKWYLETPTGTFRSDMSGIDYVFEQAEQHYPAIRSWIPLFEKESEREA